MVKAERLGGGGEGETVVDCVLGLKRALVWELWECWHGGVETVGKDERGWWCRGPAGGSPSLSLV